MAENGPDLPEPAGSDSAFLLYQTEDHRTQIDVRLDGETVWLNQRQMAELFDKDVRTVSEHIRNMFDEGELDQASVLRKYRTTASDGKSYEVLHYNLDVIISVGYRVRSQRGTQFRVWATGRLREFLVKGFTLDDQRLAENAGRDGTGRYFDELLERVRAIRTSERLFYQKVTDIYATSIDYDVNAAVTRDFFASVQNKFHYAIHGRTAAEMVVERADAEKPNMGLTTWKNGPAGPIRRTDVSVAKNYLGEEEMRQLNLIVDQYLSFAELQARQKKAMRMTDWVRKLHDFLTLNDRSILTDLGRVSHELAKQLAEVQFDRFEAKRRAFEASHPVSDFDREVHKIEAARSKSPAQRPRRRADERPPT